MTPPNPTHRVVVESASKREVRVYLEFSLAAAIARLTAYQNYGWTGEIEEIVAWN